jgi:hypothetical protein
VRLDDRSGAASGGGEAGAGGRVMCTGKCPTCGHDPGPLTYSCENAAARIGDAVTADWLKRHASAGQIPHTRSGKGRGRAGKIAFTEAHLFEILQLIEKRPTGERTTEPAAEFSSVVSRGPRR